MDQVLPGERLTTSAPVGLQMMEVNGDRNVEAPERTQIHRVFLSPVVLDPRFGPIRTPARHPISRQEGFEDLYDFDTLFYDLFWSLDGQAVTAIGPPAPSAVDPLRDLEITALPSGEVCRFKYRKAKKHPLPCSLQIAPPLGTQALRIRLDQQEWISAIQPNLSALLKERIALVTISRDNDLQWIRDWAIYHVSECEVDTLVAYDNGSRSYEVGDVALALAEIQGLRDVVLVSQESPFGPVGYPAGGGGSDSAYLKPAMFEHARHRFLGLSDLYMNLDIDELLLPKTGTSLRSYLDRDEPVALVDRRHVENLSTLSSEESPRHRQYWWRKKIPSRTLPKWVAQPKKCRPGAIFTYHQVENERAWRCPEDELAIAHFLGITTGWKTPGRLTRISGENVSRFVEDLDLRERLDRAFAPDETVLQRWTPLVSGEPLLLLRWARQLVEEERLEEAKHVIDRALEVDPSLVGAHSLRSVICECLGDHEGAADAKHQVDQLTIRNPDWYVHRAEYMRRKNVRHAISILEEAIRLGVQSPSLLDLHCDLQAQIGEPNSATETISQALESAASESNNAPLPLN